MNTNPLTTERPTAFGDLRRRHTVGRHLLIAGDGGPDWCRRCGTFDCYLRLYDGTPTPCRPKPVAERWWVK